MRRCKWCNEKNPQYIDYHDNEWGIINFDERHLFEMLILESFQAGLSWECILNKRENFRKSYDNFDIDKVCNYNEDKIHLLMKDKGIIRNKLKIKASINNAKIFKNIVIEFGSFENYLKKYFDEVIYEFDKTTNELSDKISKDYLINNKR